MPELPEVEVICRGLRPHLMGQTIRTVLTSGKPLRYPIPVAAMDRLVCGQTICDVTRRAKYLLIATQSASMVIIHLGMTGNLGVFPHRTPLKDHDHVCWRLENGLELRLNDSRRFGGVWVLAPEQATDREKGFFADTGPEPFSAGCTATHLMAIARRRRQPVKTLLMDSHVIAGIGNIYANESLFAAGIHPLRPAAALVKHDWHRLITLIRQILTEAIACGGSTISDFINVGGEHGYFQMNFKVYGRTAKPCHQCGAAIEKIQISGRASFFCPACQTE